MYPLKQSTAITIPVWAMDSSGDAVTGLVDGGFTKRISKDGGAFAATGRAGWQPTQHLDKATKQQGRFG